jgi:hypothetical protein
MEMTNVAFEQGRVDGGGLAVDRGALLDHPADAAVLAPLVEREILWRLLTGPFGDVIRQIGLPDSNLSHVNREYRRLSGGPPGQDAARLRAGS